MPRAKRSSHRRQNSDPSNFTVAEAQHLIQTHGGPIGWPQALIQISIIGVVALLVARAIASGAVNVWQVTLPMIAEYLVFIIVLPIAQIFLRHPELKRDCRGSLYLWSFLIIAGCVAEYVRAGWFTNQPWLAQVQADISIASHWLMQSSMIWPIGLAAANAVYNAITSIGKLLRYGPPYIGVGLGCGMRIAVFFLALMIVPFIIIIGQEILGSYGTGESLWQNSKLWMWLIWGLILASELLALAMKLDLQNRLKKVGATAIADSDRKSNQGPPPNMRI